MALKPSPLLKKIALTLAIMFFIFGAGLFYVNKILLPIQAKGLIIDAAAKTLQRQVTCDALQYDPLRGFVITGIVVSQKDDPAQVFFKAKSISAQIVFPALLKKKVIIPSIRIDAPEIGITRTAKDLWNFSDLLNLAAPAPTTAKPPMDVIIGGFSITNGQLLLADTSLKDDFRATIGIPSIKGTLSLNGSARITGSLTTPGAVNIDASIGLLDNSLKATLKTDRLLLTPYLRFLPVELPLNLENITLADTDVTMTMSKKTISVTGSLKLPGLKANLADGTKAQGDLSLANAVITLEADALNASADVMMNALAVDAAAGSMKANLSAPGTRISQVAGRLEASLDAALSDLAAKTSGITILGQPKIKLSLVTDPRAATPLTYTGAIETAGLNIKGLPMVDGLSNIQGKVLLGPDNAATDEMTFTLLGTPVRVNGKVTHFTTPELDLTATLSKADLSLVAKFIPEMIKDLGLTIKGTADITANINGPAANIQAAKINATAVLADVSVSSQKFNQSATAINGTVAYSTSEIAWKELSAVYLGKTWTSNGTLKDLLAPDIHASVKTDGLNADINAAKKGDTIEIITLSGTWMDTPYAVSGNVFLAPGRSPTIDISGESKLALKSLAQLLPPEQARQIEALKLDGNLEIKVETKGDPVKWQDLTSTVTVQAPTLRMMGYLTTDLAVNAHQENGRIDPLTISSKVYGGTFESSSTVDLKQKAFPFSSKARLDNVSLELFKKDTPLKQQQLSGTVAASADLTGAVMDIRNMEGTATFKVTRGYLWELEILSKVLSILSSAFKGGDVIITDADASFKIAGGKVMTDNLTLRSTTVSLVGEGWIDFDQNIDMNISPRVEPKTMEGSSNPLAEINPTAGIINIHIYNTLTAPKFEHKFSAPQILKNTLQTTVGSILKLFE